jgi:hypothetical protein
MACPIDATITDAAGLLVFLNHHREPAVGKPEPMSSSAPKPRAQPNVPLRKLHHLGKVALDPVQTKKRRLSKRSVRFGADVDVSVPTHVYSYDKVSEKDKPLVWWTSHEIRHIHKRERSMVGILSFYCDVYVESLVRLTEISFQDVADISEEGCFVLVANSPGRGLENMVSMTLTGSNTSKMVTRKVVETQQQLRHQCRDSGLVPSPELLSETLRDQYESLSFPKKRFAQFLAAGDALVARFDKEDEAVQEDSTSSTTVSN